MATTTTTRARSATPDSGKESGTGKEAAIETPTVPVAPPVKKDGWEVMEETPPQAPSTRTIGPRTRPKRGLNAIYDRTSDALDVIW